MSGIATLALFYSCYKLDKIIYEREIKSLRDEFDFTKREMKKKINRASVYCDGV